jgi:hypothetical protein
VGLGSLGFTGIRYAMESRGYLSWRETGTTHSTTGGTVIIDL